MPILAMRVRTAEQHPNADRLRVYMMENQLGECIQVVANLTNVYTSDDTVAVAQVGSVVDGLEIKQTVIRKVESFGMALGKVDAPVGTDVTDRFPEAK